MDFSNPDFTLMFLSTRFVYSNDRCKTWHGPFELPKFGRPGLLARTDYITNGPKDILAFMATEKDDGEEGWPAAIRTRDGGLTWTLEGMIGEQPGDGEYSIMPTTARLTDGGLYSWIRHRRVEDDKKIWFIDAYRSSDDGKTWGEELMIRGDGGGWDIGYPRTVQRADGKCVTVYYFHDGKRPERFIAYTIWSPPAVPPLSREPCSGRGSRCRMCR